MISGFCLDNSPVTGFHKTLLSIKLGFELVNILLLNWIYSSQNIPVNTFRTWRGGKRTFISVSIVHVNSLHKLSVWDHLDNRISFNLGPFKRIKEAVNNSNNIITNIISIIDREENTLSSSKVTINRIIFYVFSIVW